MPGFASSPSARRARRVRVRSPLAGRARARCIHAPSLALLAPPAPAHPRAGEATAPHAAAAHEIRTRARDAADTRAATTARRGRRHPHPVFQSPDSRSSARVRRRRDLVPAVGAVRSAPVADAAERLIATRLRDGGFRQTPQVTLNVVQFRSQQ